MINLFLSKVMMAALLCGGSLFHCISSENNTSTRLSSVTSTNDRRTLSETQVTTVATTIKATAVTQAPMQTSALTMPTNTPITTMKSSTEGQVTAQTQLPSTTTYPSQSGDSTIANLSTVTSGIITTTNPPSITGTGVVQEQQTPKPAVPNTVTQTRGSIEQPESTTVTSRNSNVFKTSPTIEPKFMIQTITSKITNKDESTSKAVSTSLPTKTKDQEPNGNLKPGVFSTTPVLTTTMSSTQVILTTTAPTTRNNPTIGPRLREDGVMTQLATTSITTTKISPTEAPLEEFNYPLRSQNEEKKEFVEVCKRLMVNIKDGNCTLRWRNNGKVQFQSVEINVDPNVANQHYEELTKKTTDNKTLIAILASCGALLIMIIILAVCASHHRKPYSETQQHLTEELHTVENGYHDNPTLEVMEVQPEMQEKKVALTGEFNDSWIVPIDNLLKEDMPDEEDTHL